MNFSYNNGRKVKFPADEKIVVHFDTQDPWQPTGKFNLLILIKFNELNVEIFQFKN